MRKVLPTHQCTETEEKEAFYEQLQALMDKLPRRDLKILMGDLNAKVGADNMGKHGFGIQNENGELLTEFCTTHLVLHLQRPCHWRHPVRAQADPQDNMDITRWEDRESNRSHHHRKKVEAKLTGRQSETRSICSLGPPPGGGRPEGQAESLQRPSRQAISQIQCTQPERQNKG